MNEFVKRFWRRRLTVEKWAKRRQFNARYVRAILAGKRGRLRAGEAERIINALLEDSLIQEGELQL